MSPTDPYGGGITPADLRRKTPPKPERPSLWARLWQLTRRRKPSPSALFIAAAFAAAIFLTGLAQQRESGVTIRKAGDIWRDR